MLVEFSSCGCRTGGLSSWLVVSQWLPSGSCHITSPLWPLASSHQQGLTHRCRVSADSGDRANGEETMKQKEEKQKVGVLFHRGILLLIPSTEVPLITSCVTSEKLLNPSEPPFPPLWGAGNEIPADCPGHSVRCCARALSTVSGSEMARQPPPSHGSNPKGATHEPFFCPRACR